MKKYEYTRTIRFHLEGDMVKFKVPKADKNRELFKEFSCLYEELLQSFRETVFCDDGAAKQHVEVNYKWVRRYASDNYNALNTDTRPEKYTTENAKFLGDIYRNWLINNEVLLGEFKDTLFREKENNAKRADALSCFRLLNTHDYFSFVKDFVLFSNDKKESKYIEKLTRIITQTEKASEKLKVQFMPDLNTGYEVARASFNYNTINKVSKNYGRDLDGKKRLLDKSYLFNNENDIQLLWRVGFKEYIRCRHSKSVENLSIHELYNALKDFKSEQKSKFLENIKKEQWKAFSKETVSVTKNESLKKLDMALVKGKKFSGIDDLRMAFGIEEQQREKEVKLTEDEYMRKCLEWIKNEYPLFIPKGKDEMKKFIQITKEIEVIGVQKNRTKKNQNYKQQKILDNQIRDMKIKRGEFFKGNFVFKYYFDYCNLYKRVATQRGEIFAQIRSLQQEKVEARLLKYWCFVFEKNNRHELIIIPKEGDNLQNAKNYIESLPDDDSGDCFLLGFNSLTLRALEKLMRKNGGKDLPSFNKSDENKITFYKQILSNKYQKINIDVTKYKDKLESVILKKYESLEDFRMDLEKISYVVFKKALSNENLKRLLDEYSAIKLEIKSYDLFRNIIKDKEHTQIWKQFWSSDNAKEGYPLRMNPEVRIYYRNKKDDLPEKKSKNRFSQDCLIGAFTITQNVPQEKIKLAFKDSNQLIAITKQFNDDVIKPFVKEKKKNLYYYGIDRGNQELATLGIVQYSQEEYEAMLSNGFVAKFNEPIFPKIETYMIKDEFIHKTDEMQIDKKGTIIKVTYFDNPSYFVDDKIFKKINEPFIDLTMAKVIKGKIVLNGDVKTYLSLKEANAKRKLFDIFTKIDLQADVEYCGDENHTAWNIKSGKGFIFRDSFVIKLKKEERNDYQLLCYYQNRLNIYRKAEEMRGKIQEFLDDLRSDRKMETTTIDKINNIRDAITSNMVGVISYLFKKYPGIINLENMHSKEHINKQFRGNNESIARRLEWGLYKKFQKFNLVPPELKQTIFLRDKNKELERINQFGIIHFVPIEDTSAKCPYCGEKADSKKRKDTKWGKHQFICINEKCEFNTENPKFPLEKVHNSDQVACFNIAKKGFEIFK